MRIILKVGEKALLLQEGIDVKDAVNLFEGALPVREDRYSNLPDWHMSESKIKIEIVVISDNAIEQPVIEDDFIGKEDIAI